MAVSIYILTFSTVICVTWFPTFFLILVPLSGFTFVGYCFFVVLRLELACPVVVNWGRWYIFESSPSWVAASRLGYLLTYRKLNIYHPVFRIYPVFKSLKTFSGFTYVLIQFHPLFANYISFWLSLFLWCYPSYVSNPGSSTLLIKVWIFQGQEHSSVFYHETCFRFACLQDSPSYQLENPDGLCQLATYTLPKKGIPINELSDWNRRSLGKLGVSWF